MIFARGSTGLFIGGLSRCLGWNWGSGGPLVRPAGYLTWSVGQVLWQHRLSHIGYPSCQLKLTRVEDGFWKDAKPWLAGHPLAWLGPGFVPHHPSMSYCPWTPLVLDIIKICMDFGSYAVFSSFNVPQMVDQQNSWNLLVISTYLLYLESNIGMLAVNICILWPSTPPTLRVLLVPEQKKRIKS
jgi:hypothetical protein